MQPLHRSPSHKLLHDKGVFQNGKEVAVKKLRYVKLYPDYKEFKTDFDNLMKVKHNNIVQVLGYCFETDEIRMEYEGKMICAEETETTLLVEYLHNGSLGKHLFDGSDGLDWHTRYKIIKGTCEGLQYIHEQSLCHLNLKPDNILLDKNMVPKIDFGLSSVIFNEELTRTDEELTRSTQISRGSMGYQPPEYIDRGEISNKFDIFILGVIMIQIISGPQGYFKYADIPNDEFIDLVRKNWRDRLQATASGSSLEAYCCQVETCTQIAFNCLEKDSQKRPDIVEIINKLNEIENDIDKEPKNDIDSLYDNLTTNTEFIMVPIIIFSQAPISIRSTVKSDYQSDDIALGFLCALVSVIRKYHWIKVGSERGRRRFKGPDINIYRDTCVTVVMAYVMLLVINWQYYILAPFPISLVTFITYLQNEINGSKDTLSKKKSGSKYTTVSRKKGGSKDKDRKKSDELVGAPTDHPSRSSNDKSMDKDDITKIGELERTVAIPYYILLICAIYGDGKPALSHFLIFLCYALGTLAIMYSRLANNGVNPLKQALECIQMAYLVMLFITVHTVAAEWLGEVTALVCVPELISGFVWFSSLLHGGSSNSAADKVDTDDSGLLFVPLGAVLACLTCTYGYHYEGEFLASWWYTEATVSCAVAGCMPYLSLWMISRWPGSLPISEKATQVLMFPANICLTGACLMLFALLVENTLAYGLFGLDGHINPAVLKYLYFSTAVACLVPLYVKRVLLHVDYALELPASL